MVAAAPPLFCTNHLPMMTSYSNGLWPDSWKLYITLDARRALPHTDNETPVEDFTPNMVRLNIKMQDSLHPLHEGGGVHPGVVLDSALGTAHGPAGAPPSSRQT